MFSNLAALLSNGVENYGIKCRADQWQDEEFIVATATMVGDDWRRRELVELPFKDELGIPLTGMGSRIHLPGKRSRKVSWNPANSRVLTDIPKEFTAIGWELHYDQEYKHSTPKDILDSLPEIARTCYLGHSAAFARYNQSSGDGTAQSGVQGNEGQ